MLLHTTNKTNVNTDLDGNPGLRDRIMALRWSKTTDENDNDTLPDVVIPWNYRSSFFDMGAPRDFKTVTRLRIAYQVTRTTGNTIPIVVKLVASDAKTNQGTAVLYDSGPMISAGTVDLPGGILGEIKEVWYTGNAAFPLNLTGFTFFWELSVPDTFTSNLFRPIIREVGVTYRMRKELRQF
jgi:hypothetical protein